MRAGLTRERALAGGQILQLYVASYQAPSMWRGCYKQLSGILSAQIIKDVEGFVADNDFAAQEVMRFLL